MGVVMWACSTECCSLDRCEFSYCFKSYGVSAHVKSSP